MIDRIIEEIYVCLNSNCFLAALSIALALPDICGKAEYGDIGVGARYIKWFDVYLCKYERSPKHNKDIPCLSGELVYSLRNNALHAGTFNINGKEQNIKNFELLVQDLNRAILSSSCSQVVYNYINGSETLGGRSLCINIVDLILKICTVAKRYYEENKYKFDFIDNKIVTIDMESRRKFKIKEPLLYGETFPLDKDKTQVKWSFLYDNYKRGVK